MTPAVALTLPLDRTSADVLAGENLEYALVPHDGPRFDAFVSAVARGFLDAAPTDEQRADSRATLRDRRLTGVFDAASRHPDTPVATTDSWLTQLTTEPGRTVPMWAISAVTVAPTHRRRGIARALIGGELRTAAAAGVAIAGLTVSEATIYGRFGFGPAVLTTDLTVQSRRVQWTGPRPAGRLDFVEQDELPERLAALHERVRMRRPGEVAGWPMLWRRIAGLRPGAEEAARVRAVAYRDPSGHETGILVYTLAEGKNHVFSDHELSVRALFAEHDDAYAALWRFAIEHDLVSRVSAYLQEQNPPVRWMVTDQRAVEESVVDHHWLRVLDVPAALGSRRYAHELTAVVRVEDALGFADGTWRVRIDANGEADVVPVDQEPDVTLGVAALGSILLGGVSPRTLAAAGAVHADAEAVAALERAFAPAVGARLSIWY